MKVPESSLGHETAAWVDQVVGGSYGVAGIAHQGVQLKDKADLGSSLSSGSLPWILIALIMVCLLKIIGCIVLERTQEKIDIIDEARFKKQVKNELVMTWCALDVNKWDSHDGAFSVGKSCLVPEEESRWHKDTKI